VPNQIFVVSRTPIFGGALWHVQGKGPRVNRYCVFLSVGHQYLVVLHDVHDKEKIVNLKEKM
jgi:hypothetical protein